MSGIRRSGPRAGQRRMRPVTRIAVIDIGTNSTRLLVADVNGDEVRELERRSTVTRLGRGVDTSGTLAGEAIDDVCDAVDSYIVVYRPIEPSRLTAVGHCAER